HQPFASSIQENWQANQLFVIAQTSAARKLPHPRFFLRFSRAGNRLKPLQSKGGCIMPDLDRRTFVKSVAASLAAPAIAFAASQQPNPPAPNSRTRPPNVIVMICGDLGCYGSHLGTPNLDRMASEGVRFLRFNTAHPVCSVSRAAWLTGRYATRSHVQDAYMPGVATGMDLSEKTLADILKPRGYKSMCIGKWHLGEQEQYLPPNRGFDAFLGVPYSDDMDPLPLIRDL